MSNQEQISNGNLAAEIAARRTFAIISHPDAGKTTLTEKLLLYGNAIHLAGSVRARRDQRSATSDWMAMERERGISITSTVLQFPYNGRTINLLDTPGHQDFSEDTYRTLTAADSAVMVLDAAKGVEAQTRKLFDVCRQRGIPIFTFINKMDRPSLDPLALLDEVENVLGMEPAPVNWPIGDGDSFVGVYDRHTKEVHLYDRTVRNQTISPETITTLDNPRIKTALRDVQFEELHTNVALLDEMEMNFDRAKFLAGEQTPVYFGSALTNFGVQLFLDDFVKYAPTPGTYTSDAGPITPDKPEFTGFVFKIQANMNPKHRDSVAFVRICSGRFERNMSVNHPRSGKSLKLARPYTFFAEERTVVDEAYAGDIIGLPGSRYFGIGDTITESGSFNFAPIPTFPAEHFARLINVDISKQKQFLKGLAQLETEGAMQILHETDAQKRDPILAVVGMLQFEVVEARLEEEYGVKTRRDMLPQSLARWVYGPEDKIELLPWRYGMMRVVDRNGRLVALFSSEHELNFYANKYPEITFLEQPQSEIGD
ncbi:MAG: peptide chain release factor 3 [Ardenticatenaceae bacterium]|nr:peptide chain release factor 3 [Ardenticatenaceae bacterium]MCB9445652.1 peptide chain release factor 3 [Ardenticatenaceae bacterium]